MYRVPNKRTTCIAALVLQLSVMAPVAAQDGWDALPPPGHIEAWTGVIVRGSNWSGYTGATISPFAGITDEGLRLRVVTGYGGYSYDRTASVPVTTTGKGHETTDVREVTMTYDAEYSFADVLIGYQFQTGPLTTKVFVGPSTTFYTMTPRDMDFMERSEYGVKGALEFWYNATDQIFLKADVAGGYYLDNDKTFATVDVNTAAGYRLGSDWQLGVEAALTSKRRYLTLSGGLFTRYLWTEDQSTRLSGGFTHDDYGGDVYVHGSHFFRY
ncbi:MAG: cellulose biosynthesis protein BcsS [Pseudomonadota bacterium]